MKRCMGCMEMYEDRLEVCPYCGYEENSLPEEAFHLTPGTLIADRYLVGRVLGFGGFGVTYIGYDKVLEKRVAIKEYLPSEFATRSLHQTKVTVYGGDKSEQFGLGMTRFIEEARKLAKFDKDTGIVNVYDSLTENDTAYIIMEYLEGESLKELLEQKGKLSLEETEEIILPIYRSLGCIHEAGIIHRDIAPDNIFLTKDGRVKLLDFGAARYASATHSRSLTVIYKPGYAPEEQYQSRGEQGPWTDVYALAATLYKCITGITPDASLERKVKDTLKEPSKLGVAIPKNKETALMNALNIQIKYRTKSAEEFVKEWESKGKVIRVIEKLKRLDVGKLSRKARAGILAGIFAVATGIALLISFGGVLRVKDAVKIAQGDARVPSVINENFDKAITITENAGIHILQENTKYDRLIEKGRVLTQNVEAGQVMNTANNLLVVVSGGIRQIYVPEITGSTKETAIAALEQEGFQYSVEEEYSATAVGNAIRTSYPAGTACDEGTKLVLYVSKGLDPATITDTKKRYVVEDYSNKTVKEVEKILAEYGITLDSSEQVESEEIAEGRIVSQKTKPGTELAAGAVIKVVKSTGVPMVNIGDITGWQFEERKAALKEKGITLEKGKETYDNNKKAGLILSAETETGTTVKNGMELKKGTKVICKVSKGPKPTPKPTATSKPKATATPKPTKKPTATPKPTKKPTPTPIPHSHSYDDQYLVVRNPGCTSDGEGRWYCSCGDFMPNTISAIGHSWRAATCTEAERCTVCGATGGAAKGHNWNAATCTEAKKCARCGATEGAAKGHNWEAATCTEAKKCRACGATEGAAKGHNWEAATCTKAKKCRVCGVTEGNAKGHSWKAATCTEAKKCTICGVTEGSATGHNITDDGEKRYCTKCRYVEATASWGEWSAWSTTEVSATAKRQVETRVENVSVQATEYRYVRTIWYREDSTLHSSYKPPYSEGYTEGTPKPRNKKFAWDYTSWMPESQRVAGVSHTSYTTYSVNGTTYYEEESRTVSKTVPQTQYRYRDKVYRSN